MQLTSISPAINEMAARHQLRIEDSRYLVHHASTVEEVEAALKLRFEVFNLELGEGLESSFLTGRDRDEFDATCDHLIVTEKATGNIIGTYRLRAFEIAGSADGFYSSAEFDLQLLPADVLQQSMELGRACIARAHRDHRVLFLLWRAVVLNAVRQRKRYLFGCCSLTSQDPAEGKQLFQQLKSAGHLHPTLFVSPKPGFECLFDDFDTDKIAPVKVPRLFSTYLGIGARVCSPPALDRRFKTIDFFVLFDLQSVDARTRMLLF